MPAIKASKASAAEASNLAEGLHPAFLLAITDDPTPEEWPMYKNSPRMFTWHFAVFPTATGIGRDVPEYQQGFSSQKCSFGGKRASKCYEWTVTLLGRPLALGESIDLDPAMPLPCQVSILRHDAQQQPSDFAKIEKLYAWPEGATWRQNPQFYAILRSFWDGKRPPEAPPFPGQVQAPAATAPLPEQSPPVMAGTGIPTAASSSLPF